MRLVRVWSATELGIGHNATELGKFEYSELETSSRVSRSNALTINLYDVGGSE
jgi:hypothetical protein